MATVADYCAKLRRRLGDTGPYFTTDELVDFANEAQRDLSMRLKPSLLPELTQVMTGPLLANNKFDLPSDIAQYDSLTLWNTTNQDIEVRLVGVLADYNMLKAVNPFYQPSHRQVFGYVDAGEMYIEPSTPGMKYRFRYIKSPVSLTTSQEMDLDDRWEDLSLDYGQYLALLKEKRASEAQVVYAKYVEKINAVNGGKNAPE